MAVHQFSGSEHLAASGTGASLMEVSAFMTEQLKARVVEQRAHDKDQHAEMMQLLAERDAKLEAQRREFETKLEAQTRASETKVEAQRRECSCNCNRTFYATQSHCVSAMSCQSDMSLSACWCGATLGKGHTANWSHTEVGFL